MKQTINVTPEAIAKAVNDLLDQRNALAAALEAYLAAGHKRARESAAAAAKAALRMAGR